MAERAFIESMVSLGATLITVGTVSVHFPPPPYEPRRRDNLSPEENDPTVEVHEPEISDAPEDEAFDRWFNHTPIPVKG